MNPLDMFGGAGEMDELRSVVTAFVGMERDFHDAIRNHYDALGIEPPPPYGPPEERIDRLCLLVEHHVRGDHWTYFIAEQAPEELENHEAAREYAGISESTWHSALAAFAAEAPENEGETERERADWTVRERFGVGLETFERAVVEWSPERTLKRGLRGPVDTDIERLRVATEALGRLQDGDDRSTSD